MSDLSELFDRDPLSLSEQDIVKIVARMREAAAQYEMGARAPVVPKAPKPKKTNEQIAANILKDLGLI
jgi:hypothetical protein